MIVNDLNILTGAKAAYELRKDVVYLVVCDGKHFDFQLAHALLAKVEEEGINLHIVVSQHAKGIKVSEEGPAPVECDCQEDAGKVFGGHKPECPNAIPF